MIETYFDLLLWLAANPFKSILVLLVQFAIVMKLHHKYHNPVLHFLLSLWFIPQDIVVNAVVLSIIGVERPQEWTATSRLKRWKKYSPPKGTRQVIRSTFAWTMCDIINRYDMGHC